MQDVPGERFVDADGCPVDDRAGRFT